MVERAFSAAAPSHVQLLAACYLPPWPVHWLPPFWQLAVLAVPAAPLSLLVYRAVSNQRAIRDAKDKIIAHLLEQDFSRRPGSAARLAGTNISQHRTLYSLVPMAVLLPIFVMPIAQVESRFAFRGSM